MKTQVQNVTIGLEPKMIKAIDSYAKENHLDRSKTIRVAVDRLLNHAKKAE